MTHSALFRSLLGGIGLSANQAFGGKRHKPHPPFDGKPSGMSYINKIKDMLMWTRHTQSENILEASYAVARTIEKGETCWSYWDHGHTHNADAFPDRDGNPDLITIGYDAQKSKKGDIVMMNYPFSMDLYHDIAQKDLFVIGGPSPVSGDCIKAEDNIPSVREFRVRPLADIWIETQITSIGALVKIPGSPAPLGPASGPVNLTLWWMIVADACRILSLKGKKINVNGDEPELAGDKAPWIDLNNPLMDDYFDTVLRQMEMLGSEIGDMRKMAKMAAETLISGGTVYFYSRYAQSLAAESTARRGGFGFAKSLSDGNIKGSNKDMVIMGITRPDDPADLQNLRSFRKKGMKIASIGPVTKNGKLPENDTVPQKSDVHVGRVCDSYGLYAIPGFNRKVCPTSGIMNVTSLWAASVEIAMEIIKQTGNTPGIYFSGALSWGGSVR